MSFSAGASAEKANQQTQSQNDLPQWLKDAYQQNLASAQGIADQGFTAYGGPMTAGDNDYLAFARDQAVGGTHAGRGQLDNADKVFNDIANQSPYLNSARQLAGTDLSAYANPYQQQVIDQSNAAIDRQRQMADQQNAYAASQAGAFGGSRHGVVDAENAKNFAQMQQENTNALLNQGYDRATALASADVDRLTANDQFNTAIDQQNTAFNLQAAQGLMGSALQRQNQAYQGAELLGRLGGQLQSAQQAGLDASYQEFLRQQQDPFQRQQLMNSAVFGIDQAGLTSSTGSSKSSGTKLSAGGGGGLK